ncbi:MAG TPA: hypothetical protein VEK07_08415 [Polyangiaceae bacterium]|nr:hypothetical protein [Polyangiaceae bacterium]
MQIARAHAALAAGGEREHAQLQIHLRASDELRELRVRQDDAFLANAAHLGHAHRGDRALLDELVGDRRAEHAPEHAVDVRDGRAPASLRDRFVEEAAHVRRPDIAQGQMADRRPRIHLEIAPFLVHHADADPRSALEPGFGVLTHPDHRGSGRHCRGQIAPGLERGHEFDERPARERLVGRAERVERPPVRAVLAGGRDARAPQAVRAGRDESSGAGARHG